MHGLLWGDARAELGVDKTLELWAEDLLKLPWTVDTLRLWPGKILVL